VSSSRLRATLVLGLVACASLACRGSAPEPARAPAPPAPKGPAPGGELAHAASFDLVATSEGAVLAWAPGTCGQGVQLQRLDVDARVQRAVGLDDAVCGRSGAGEIVELSAAAGGGRLGVAWLAQSPEGARVFASHAGDGAESFAPVLPLGAAEPERPSGRGRLSIVASESAQLRVSWQAPRAACAGQSESCAQLITEPFPPRSDAAGRRTDTREIPRPCPRLLVGSVWTLGVWYDAFCALEGDAAQPISEVYAIRPEIFYAEAQPTLPDCEPLGVSPSRAGALIWGRCADGLRVHTLVVEGRRRILGGVQRSVRCEAGRPVLRVEGRGGASETLELEAPRDRLELWLPETLASPDSRAVFTGRRLLVAEPHAGKLTLRSHRCEAGTLVSEQP
jgi:hypothetical protein